MSTDIFTQRWGDLRLYAAIMNMPLSLVLINAWLPGFDDKLNRVLSLGCDLAELDLAQSDLKNAQNLNNLGLG